MKTKHMTINEENATITISSIEKLTSAEWRIFESYKNQGFKVRNKRKKAKNAMHKKAYYLKKLSNDIAATAMFETLCETEHFATAVKWFREVYETGKFAAEQKPETTHITAVASAA